jgi:hypothetical protein
MKDKPVQNRGSNILKNCIEKDCARKKLRYRLRKKIAIDNLYVPTLYLQALKLNAQSNQYLLIINYG